MSRSRFRFIEPKDLDAFEPMKSWTSLAVPVKTWNQVGLVWRGAALSWTTVRGPYGSWNGFARGSRRGISLCGSSGCQTSPKDGVARSHGGPNTKIERVPASRFSANELFAKEVLDVACHRVCLHGCRVANTAGRHGGSLSASCRQP